MQQYITEKVKSYANSNIKQELALPARNILENLLLALPFVKDSQVDTETSRFHIDTEKIKIALEEIVIRISSFVPEFESHILSRNRFSSSRSFDEKQKAVSFAP
jgi:hypothetical protein